ncbi:MAG TPA: Re/Si-specific NAD(P)(+) transhydrogenase subunit alpha [Gammaproteobacteria bacterium]|nr:Re/Si-specific NAD(P)(+) transhydrogenase subunit alpha [Gammaproteobacteria bacterium]
MRIGVPKEVSAGEKRVATTPDAISHLRKLGFSVAVESGAGTAASFGDDAYRAAGADVVPTAEELWASSDIVLKVRAPTASGAEAEIDRLRRGQVLIAFLAPGQNAELLRQLAEKGVTALAVESIPRISRAQKADALSSMANIAGYRAVIEAAEHFGRFFMGQITAAGKIAPAKVLVIGAGVAGLSAIGTAKSLGAIVRAFDTRPAVKEQVESMDAEFLMLDFAESGEGSGGYAKVMSPEFIAAEMALFRKQAEEVDIIVTTALIPGKPAPELITREMVEAMKPGSVIVDLAAEQGGNCALTVPGEVVVHGGVTIIGYTDLPSRMAAQSSQLYATNLRHLLTDLCPAKNGELVVDMDDEVIRGATVVKDGEITWPPPPPRISAASSPGSSGAAAAGAKSAGAGSAAAAGTATAAAVAAARPRWLGPVVVAVLGALVLAGLGLGAPPVFMSHFTVFVLACFVGYMVVWNVTPALHTPLMSVTNAISSIIIIGALLQISSPAPAVLWTAAFAALITSVNIAGGFAVTRRMLAMFRK